MKLYIDVTQEDIDNGVRRSPSRCMVKLSFDRATEGAFPEARVTTRCIWIRQIEIDLSENVWRKIGWWDTGVQTRPFSFEVEIPEGLTG